MEGISIDFEKIEKLTKGIKFDLNKMVNKETADNFFAKIAKKISPSVYLMFFSSLPGCDILVKKNPAINLNVVQIGLVSPVDEKFYITLNFAEGESAVDKYSKQINDQCIGYANALKGKLSEFYDLAKNYFKVKKEKENLNSKNTDVAAKNEKATHALDSAKVDKKVQNEKLEKDKTDLEQATREKNNLETELKRKYTGINELKTQKAKFEKDLEELKKQMELVDKEVEQAKQSLDSFEKTKEQTRIEHQVHEAQIDETQKKIDQMDKENKEQKNELKRLSEDKTKLDKQISDATSGIADHKMRINSEQSNVDKIKNVDSQNALKKKNKLLEDLQKELVDLKKQLDDINKELSESENNVKKNKEEVKNVLNDPEQQIKAKKDELTKIMIDIKQYLDDTKKLFPNLPDIYWDNIWRFVSVNHSEALNYLKGMRPSIFGLYDNLFTNKHPEKTINDVDFVPLPLNEVVANAKQSKKKKLKRF